MKTSFCGFLVCVLVLYSCGNSSENPNVNRNNAVQDSTQIATSTKKQKMNKKNLVVKEWNTNVQTNVRVLDHVTTYNADGQKIEEIEYNLEGQKWRERYEYDTNGFKTKELLYDSLNKLVSVKKFEYNEFGKKKVTYTYNAKGSLVSVKNYEYLAQ